MTFSSPYMLLTLLLIPAAILAFQLAERRRMRYALTFTNVSLLAQVVGRSSVWRRYVPMAFFLLALASLCVAMARPHRSTRIARDRATVILVIDVSGSMQAKDVKPTRLGAAQAAVRTFLDKVPKRVKVGLVAFAGEADVAAAPTTDRDSLRASVDALDGAYGPGGTAIGDALAAAVDLARASVTDGLAAAQPVTSTHGLASVLFLSDGAQNRGILLPADGAARAKAAGVPVFTVALGTPNGVLPAAPPGYGGGMFGSGGPRRVPPDPATLRQIASVTGGQFFDAQSSDALQSAYGKLGTQLGRTKGTTEMTSAFLGLGALLLVSAGMLGALWSPRLP